MMDQKQHAESIFNQHRAELKEFAKEKNYIEFVTGLMKKDGYKSIFIMTEEERKYLYQLAKGEK